MASPDRLSICLPLAVSAATVFCTVIVHVLATISIVHFVRRARGLGIVEVRFRRDVLIVVSVVLVLFGAHLLEIAVWGGVLEMCGEFPAFGSAFYHSGGNFTTLGSGDAIISGTWRLLAPMEAANGMLMFGVSTAIIFTVIERIARSRFAELNEVTEEGLTPPTQRARLRI